MEEIDIRSDKTVLSAAGCMSDVVVLNKMLRTRFME